MNLLYDASSGLTAADKLFVQLTQSYYTLGRSSDPENDLSSATLGITGDFLTNWIPSCRQTTPSKH